MADPAPPPIALILGLFVVFFLIMWTGVVFLISRVSGWSELAKAYPGPADAKPTRFRYQTAYLRFGSRYRGVLCFDTDSEGFTTVPIWLFKIGHAPLRVPWADVTAVEETWLFFPYVRLTFAAVPDVPMRLHKKFARDLLGSGSGSLATGAIAPR